MKLKKYLALGLAAIGLVHIVAIFIAIFTSIIAGKLESLAESGEMELTYMSLMCGALLILSGMIIFMLADKQKEASFLSKPLLLTEIVLVIDGILAVSMMPENPCAWVILLLALPLPFIGHKSKK